MSRVNFTQLWSDNQEITRLQTHIKTVLNPLLELPISDGVMIENLDIGTGDTVVNHKLGRNCEGFLVVRLKSNATIYESSTVNATPENTIILKASGAATANIYFF